MARFLRRMPRASIGFYLVAMVLAVALPILVFVVVLLAQLEAGDREALKRRISRDATTIATTVDRQLHDMSVTLRLLTSYPELTAGDIAAFQQRTQAALRSGSYFLLLVRADGQQLMNTRVPYGSSLGKVSDIESLQSAIESKRLEVSDVFFGQTGKRWVFNVVLPLLPEESAAVPEGGALILTQNVDDMGSILNMEGLPEGWSAALVDGSGHLIVSSGADQPGEKFSVDLMANVQGTAGTVESGFSDPGYIAGYARVPGWSWNAIVWGPIDIAQATLVSTWRRLLIGGLALGALAIALALVVGRQLRNSVLALADMAQRVGRGEIVSPIETRVTEVDRMAMAMSEASFDRSQAEDRIRFVLRELAHRTKNLLSVIQAMMRQTARRSDTIEAFQNIVGQRLQGLARSIDLLTAENWGGVSMRQLIHSHLESFVDNETRIETKGDDILLKSEAVQNLGMALHELATNAVKYGALSAPSGRILIEWHREAGEPNEELLLIVWKETGGPRATRPKHKGFGTMVIDMQVKASLRADVKLDYRREGLTWTVRAPLEQVLWEPAKTEPHAHG